MTINFSKERLNRRRCSSAALLDRLRASGELCDCVRIDERAESFSRRTTQRSSSSLQEESIARRNKMNTHGAAESECASSTGIFTTFDTEASSKGAAVVGAPVVVDSSIAGASVDKTATVGITGTDGTTATTAGATATARGGGVVKGVLITGATIAGGGGVVVGAGVVPVPRSRLMRSIR